MWRRDSDVFGADTDVMGGLYCEKENCIALKGIKYNGQTP